MDLDWTAIATNLVVMAVGSGATWLFGSVLKMRRDLDAAFRKLRDLEGRDDAVADSWSDAP